MWTLIHAVLAWKFLSRGEIRLRRMKLLRNEILPVAIWNICYANMSSGNTHPQLHSTLYTLLTIKISSLRAKRASQLYSITSDKKKHCDFSQCPACRKTCFRHAGRCWKSEMKFVSLCAEAYVDTPSRDWQKHKIAVISVKNGDFLMAYACIFLLLKTI